LIHCVSYSPSIDLTYSVDDFAAGNTYTGLPTKRCFAGKAVNVARVIKLLGEEVTLEGIIAQNDADRFEEYLDSLGIATDLYRVEGNIRINTTIKDNATGGITHLSSASATLPKRIQYELEEKFKKKYSSGESWVISGSLPDGFDSNTYAKIITDAAAAGVTTMLDTRGEPLSYGVRARPDMIKPNLSELEFFFGEPVKGIHHIALKAKRLIDMGVKYAFISLGSDGMIAVHGTECLLCSPPDVAVVNTVGSGDAMVAAIMVSGVRGLTFLDTCRLAVACGASNASLEGTGVIDAPNIWKLMEQVNVEVV